MLLFKNQRAFLKSDTLNFSNFLLHSFSYQFYDPWRIKPLGLSLKWKNHIRGKLVLCIQWHLLFLYKIIEWSYRFCIRNFTKVKIFLYFMRINMVKNKIKRQVVKGLKSLYVDIDCFYITLSIELNIKRASLLLRMEDKERSI